MYAYTLLVTFALAAVMNVSAANSDSFGSYGDGSTMRNSDYYDDNYRHGHEYHDHSSHGPDFESQKTLVTRSLLPEMDPIAEVQAQIPAVEAEIPTTLSDVNPISEGAFAGEVMEDSPLGEDPIAEGATLAGITQNSSPINSLPYVHKMDPYRGYPLPPQAPQYRPPQPQYRPPSVYERYPSPYAPRYQQYTPPPPPPNPYGPPPPRYIPS